MSSCIDDNYPFSHIIHKITYGAFATSSYDYPEYDYMYSDEEELPSYKPNTKPTAAPTSSMLGEDTKPQPTTALSPYTKPRPTKAPSPSVLHEVMKFVSWSKYELVPTLYDHLCNEDYITN